MDGNSEMAAWLGSKTANVERDQKGFTLIELLITVAMIAILAMVALPVAELTVKRSQEQELRKALYQIREAIDAYKQATDIGRVRKASDESGYPPSLDKLVAGVEDAKDPTKRKIYFLRRIPRNPLWQDSTVPSVDTWGKRNYASSHDDPQEGNDVYDVYAPSGEVGLNGVPYKDW